jgi:hypothetical protein
MDGVIISMLASSVADRGFEPRSGKTKDYKIASPQLSSTTPDGQLDVSSFSVAYFYILPVRYICQYVR